MNLDPILLQRELDLPISIEMKSPLKIAFLFFLIAVFQSFSVFVAAAPMNPKLLPRLSQVDETKIIVGKDLRAKIRYKGSYLIQTPDAEIPKMRTISYDKNEMKLNYFRAWTQKGASQLPVASSMIQKIPVNEDSGFSNVIGVEVAFPQMKVGSTVVWEYELEELQVPLHGFFSHVLHLDSEFYSAKGFSFEIESAVPLQSLINDQEKTLIATKTKFGYRARLKRDLNHSVIDESYGYLSRNRFPTILYSTAKDWKSVGPALIKAYETRLAEPMPEFLKGVVSKVRGVKGLFAQTRLMHQMLKGHVRYMGDWRGRFSAQVPRSLKMISDSGFGDCKDYSLMAVRVLRELGYEAHFASVYSDRVPVPDIYYKLPVNYFNHQIVHVQVGKTDYWFDPTSQEDISFLDDALVNRSAVVWKKAPVVLRIPRYSEDQNGFNYKLVLNPGRVPGQFNGDLEVESWGLESKFSKGEENSADPMLKWLVLFFPDIKSQSQEFHTHSPRVRKPWASRQRGIGVFENVFDKTPVGDGFRVGFSNFLRAILDVDSKWISDFDFGFPSRRNYSVLIRDRMFVGAANESCTVDSPWMSVKLSVKNEGRNASLSYSEVFKSTEIPNSQVRTRVFKDFQSKIKSCLVGRVLILAEPGAASRGLASVGGSVPMTPMMSTPRTQLSIPAMKLFSKSSVEIPDPVGGGSSPRKTGPDPVIKLKRVSGGGTKRAVAAKPVAARPAASAKSAGSAKIATQSETSRKAASAKTTKAAASTKTVKKAPASEKPAAGASKKAKAKKTAKN